VFVQHVGVMGVAAFRRKPITGISGAANGTMFAVPDCPKANFHQHARRIISLPCCVGNGDQNMLTHGLDNYHLKPCS
jgi:hypothetical protein